ncbi:hypothetical protein ACJ73_06294 [Blastomyces percursus]|uniref:BZIP domain-containing protein n=1 Tax=Blastomyces percursus TaxID=1658174 RepID=A0A1J9Q1B3_9EURO|nr:hypothetical protein ACJ73_06294 [Blastomyces percursus]
MEKRQQQNVKAQRKYRRRTETLEPLQGTKAIVCVGEKLRERLSRLDELAASAMQSHAIQQNQLQTLAHLMSQQIAHAAIALRPIRLERLIYPMPLRPHPVPIHKGAYSSAGSTSTAVSTCDSTIFVDPSSLLINDKSNGAPNPYWTTTINCGYSVSHLQLRTKSTRPFDFEEIRILNFRPDTATPDPYASDIGIQTLCTMSVLYTIGMHVGLTENMICSENSLSPFFWSGSGLDSDNDTAKANTICTVQKVFSTLKPDLRPSIAQITVQYLPYIDILPFSTLRNNLISHQEEIDKDEFFHDMLTGLVCWGSGGIGKGIGRVLQSLFRQVRHGDARSWEAKALLGKEDGELVQQSEWWRSIRGDAPGIEVHSLS